MGPHSLMSGFCHLNADSYGDLTFEQIYRQHENEKKRQYARRVTLVEQGTFTQCWPRSVGCSAIVFWREKTLIIYIDREIFSHHDRLP